MLGTRAGSIGPHGLVSHGRHLLLERLNFDGNFIVNTPVPTPPRPMTLLVNWHRRISK